MNKETGAVPKTRPENKCPICTKPAQFVCENCTKILYCSQICHDLDDRNQCKSKVLATQQFGQFGDLAGPMPTSKPTQRPPNVLAIAKKPEIVVGEKIAMLPLQARTNNVMETPKPKHHATKVEEEPIQEQLQDDTEAINKVQLPAKATFDETKKTMEAKWKSHFSIPENNTPVEVLVTRIDKTEQCIWVLPMPASQDLFGYLDEVTKIHLIVYRTQDDLYYRTDIVETGPQIKIRMIDCATVPAMFNEEMKPAFAFKITPKSPLILYEIKCGSKMVIKISPDDPKIAQIVLID